MIFYVVVFVFFALAAAWLLVEFVLPSRTNGRIENLPPLTNSRRPR